MISLLFILIGAVTGVWHGHDLSYRGKGPALAQDILLQLLLFFTSATFGANGEVRSSLGNLGASSLLTALLATAFSVIAGTAWGRRFDKTQTGGSGDGAAPPAQASRRQSLITAASVAAGWLAGAFLLGESSAPSLSAASTFCLHGLLLVIGYDLGRNRIWHRLAEFGPWSVTLPVAVGAATLVGAAVSGIAFGLPLGRALSAGAGFGWYSLAGAVALEAAGAEVGAYVFMANLFRELITVIAAPLLCGRISAAAGAAMGGATSMDSTLPAITRSFGPMGTMWGLITGTTLSLLTPFLLQVFLRLPQ